MCRLLAVATRQPMTLVSAVPDELPLFTALSERHKDGWGVAWYAADGVAAGASDARAAADGAADGGLAGAAAGPSAADDDPSLVRSEGAEGLEVRRGIDTARASNAYGDAIAEDVSDLSIVHLRRASKGIPLRLVNTHPFTDGAVAFAHNGQFDMPAGFRERVLERGGRVPVGGTDSELFFSLIELHARELGWARGIQEAALEVTHLIQDLGGRYPEGLNCLVMTPDAVYAYAQSDPDQLEATSPWETYELRLLVGDDRVVVSSSGYDLPGFEAFAQGEAATIRRGTLDVERHVPLDGFRLAPAWLLGEAEWTARREAARETALAAC